MQYRNPEEVALRMYRTCIALAISVERCGTSVSSERQIINGLGKMNQAILSVHSELFRPPVGDLGRIEGYIAGVGQVRDYLRSLGRNATIDDAISDAEAALAAGDEALDVYLGRVPDEGESEPHDPRGDVHEIVSDLRAAVEGSNVLTEDQKQDALGYIDAITAVLKMASPDRNAFAKLIGGLSKLATAIGSVALSELVKELIKWGFKNLIF